MELEPGSITQLSRVISDVVAPAFLIGAVASFISILMSRMNGVMERLRFINDLPEEGHAKSVLKADIPRLKQRAKLLQSSLLLSIASGSVAVVLIIVAFGAALLQRSHLWGAAILFVVSMVLLCAALVVLAAEVKIGLNEFDQH